jgi:RHS repeat-associated protein
MKKRARLVFAHGLALSLGLCLLTAGALSQDSTPKASQANLPGQSTTLLPDGRWLLLGGFGPEGPVDTAAIRDGGTTTQLAGAMGSARAWQTATVAPDGRVIIIGGLGSNGKAVAAVERFDPSTGDFSAVNVTGLKPREHHTATLLSDGEILIVGGVSSDGKTFGTAQLLNPKNGTVEPVQGGLATPCSDQTATLQADGTVLIVGGANAQGNKVRTKELYDPKPQSFSVVKDAGSVSSKVTAPEVSGSIPSAGAKNVPVNADVSIRFSQPVDVETVNPDTITLSGPDGNVAAKVVAAEAGRLAFVTPDSPLAPDTAYTVTVGGVMGTDGTSVPVTSISFTTGTKAFGGAPPGSLGASGETSTPEAGVWIPTSNWRTNLPPSPWQSLPPYRAARGVTALSGQVLTWDGNPLARVTLQVGNKQTTTDGSGRFLLIEPGSDWVVLLIDGTSANNGGRSYGIFQVGVYVEKHETTVLPFTIWMPVLDTPHAVTIPSPTISDTVVTNPLLPGLELDIPAGTVIRDINNNAVRTLTITAVPLDRPPFPLPVGVEPPVYFTIQPGGATLYTADGKTSGARLIYPNPSHLAPGTPFDFWDYSPQWWSWYVYGHGAVSSDGKSIVPNPGVKVYRFTGAMTGGGGMQPTPNPPPDGCPVADPVDCSTGLFIESHTDISLKDVIPIQLKRTYRTADTRSRPFGIGATDNYELFIYSPNGAGNYSTINLVLPDGALVQYTRISGTGLYDSILENLSTPGIYYGSKLSFNGSSNLWILALKNGTVYSFPEGFQATNPASVALIGITDRYGNKLTITRDSNYNITQITSPNGRWIQLQHDSSNRITQIQDDLSRTVTYSYDSCRTGMLCSVTDANGGVTSFTYDSGDRMLTMTDPRSNTVFTNQYDTAGRVSQQTLADGVSTWQFGYSTDANGNVTQATITDPDGVVQQRNFNVFTGAGSTYTGFLASEVLAVGKPEQQTTTYTRDPSSNFTTSKTDQLGRVTNYTYDSLGNLTSITRLAGTPQAVTTTYTYTSAFSELASVTDPLNHTWTLGYDNRGDLTSITDPLSHQINVGYNFQGQLISITDPQNDTTQFGYSYGDLASITDPVGNITRLYNDNAGRMVSLLDALGNLTQISYDNLDRITQILDANGGTTAFSYDGNGNLLTLTDAGHNQTTYTYDKRNRRTTRTDALNKAEGYTYDGNGNLTQYTDRRGTVDTFSYDGVNRRTFAGFGKNGSNYEESINYTRDGGNRLTQAVDSIAGTVARTYDGLDRLTEEQTSQGDVTYGYDNANRRTSMTVAGQSAVSYSWDNANRLTQIAQGSSTIGLVYDNANRRTTLTLPNNVTVAYTYDNASRVTGMTYSAGSTQLGNLSYSYDADGRRTSSGGSLAAVTLPASVSGNTFNADNGMTGFNGTTLSYDANGNLTGDGTNTYTWDARNHLNAISGGSTASFVYDAFGRRASKTIGSSVTQFLYDGRNPVQELDGGNPPSVTANLLTGLNIDEYFTRIVGSTTSTLLADALGSTIGLVGSGGTIATSYTYQPFGAVTTGGAGNTNPFQFTGRENDATGLYFYRNRYYSPTYQRFIAQDPIEFRGGINLYAYALNNPISFRDPFGRCSGESLALFPTPDPNCMLQNLETSTGAAIPPLCIGAGAVCVASGFPPACILAITTCSYGIGVEAYCSSQSVGVEPPPLPPEPPVPPPPE